MEKLRISTQGEGVTQEISAVRRTRTPSELRAFAFRKASICLGLALASVFLPGIHFVAVPAFLVASGVVMRNLMQQKLAFKFSDGECASCHFSISGREVFIRTLPQQIVCEKCGRYLRVEMLD